MTMFSVWLGTLGDAFRVRVDGVGNAQWLLDRLGRSFLFKTSDPMNEEEGSSCCSFCLAHSPQTSRRGMARANKRDYDGAIADYSAAVRAPNIPEDMKAMAVYNRALAYSAIHDDVSAAKDLAAVLAMPRLPASVRTHAQQRRDRIRRRD